MKPRNLDGFVAEAHIRVEKCWLCCGGNVTQLKVEFEAEARHYHYLLGKKNCLFCGTDLLTRVRDHDPSRSLVRSCAMKASMIK